MNWSRQLILATIVKRNNYFHQSVFLNSIIYSKYFPDIVFVQWDFNIPSGVLLFLTLGDHNGLSRWSCTGRSNYQGEIFSLDQGWDDFGVQEARAIRHLCRIICRGMDLVGASSFQEAIYLLRSTNKKQKISSGHGLLEGGNRYDTAMLFALVYWAHWIHVCDRVHPLRNAPFATMALDPDLNNDFDYAIRDNPNISQYEPSYCCQFTAHTQDLAVYLCSVGQTMLSPKFLILVERLTIPPRPPELGYVCWPLRRRVWTGRPGIGAINTKGSAETSVRSVAEMWEETQLLALTGKVDIYRALASDNEITDAILPVQKI